MKDEQLTEELARRILGWKTAPDRFIMSNRRWLPRWRFQPTKNIAEAFQLLEAAGIVGYVLHADRNGVCVKLRTSAASAEVFGSSLPLTICVAIARTCGINVEASA